MKWKELAKKDGRLTSKWVDNENGKCHKIVTQDQFPVNESAIEVEKFLDGEYSKSMNSVQYRPVSYLPSDSFLQLGLFAKEDIPKSSVIEGVAGFLAEIGDDEVVNGYNDVSILYSRMRNTQWMMLGPVSFVNAACRSNDEYRQKNKIVYCIATKDISMDQELTVFYHRHYFGLFDAECLCPFKTEHGDPFPYNAEPARKRKKLLANKNFETPQQRQLGIKTVRKMVLEKLPPRRSLYGKRTPQNDDSSSAEEHFVSYESVFAGIGSLSTAAVTTAYFVLITSFK